VEIVLHLGRWLRQDRPMSQVLNFTDAQSAIIHGEIMSSKIALVVLLKVAIYPI
jgi:hypothetical protein